MLRVTSIAKGIVIDHIPAGEGIKIFNFLELDKVSYRVALLMNVPSKKMKCKDIIKIENEIDINLDILSVLNKDITINVIEDEKIVNKYNPKIPKKIESVIKCKNPRCVTTLETKLKNKYILISEESKEYCCQYCEEVIKLTSL